jgi:hypothetical protein
MSTEQTLKIHDLLGSLGVLDRIPVLEPRSAPDPGTRNRARAQDGTLSEIEDQAKPKAKEIGLHLLHNHRTCSALGKKNPVRSGRHECAAISAGLQIEPRNKQHRNK